MRMWKLSWCLWYVLCVLWCSRVYFVTGSVRQCVDLWTVSYCLSVEIKCLPLFVSALNVNITVALMYRMMLVDELMLSNCVVVQCMWMLLTI